VRASGQPIAAAAPVTAAPRKNVRRV
jgi:hypothetical protein